METKMKKLGLFTYRIGEVYQGDTLLETVEREEWITGNSIEELIQCAKDLGYTLVSQEKDQDGFHLYFKNRTVIHILAKWEV
jgi:hypothetical protein